MEISREELIALVEKYDILLGNYELQPDNHSKRALRAFLEEYPGIPNYDSKGNWIGNVRNENGWTP